MKKIILILCACLLLTGCGGNYPETVHESESEDKQMEETNMFICVQKHSYIEGRDYDVVYHRDTKVMYTVSYGNNNHGNFTLLVNADGSPMIYEGEVEE